MAIRKNQPLYTAAATFCSLVRTYCASKLVGNGTTVMPSSNNPFSSINWLSTRTMCWNIQWWLIHMIRMNAKLIT